MKILATFDGTPFSEATVPILQRMANNPASEFVLVAVAHEPSGRLQHRGVRRRITVPTDAFANTNPVSIDRGEPRFAETKDQAFDRARHELEYYLEDIGRRVGGANVSIEAHISDEAAKVIIEIAREEQPDVIVMATRSRSGISHLLFGSTTEKVVRSSVAPVLVVHPKDSD